MGMKVSIGIKLDLWCRQTVSALRFFVKNYSRIWHLKAANYYCRMLEFNYLKMFETLVYLIIVLKMVQSNAIIENIDPKTVSLAI